MEHLRKSLAYYRWLLDNPPGHGPPTTSPEALPEHLIRANQLMAAWHNQLANELFILQNWAGSRICWQTSLLFDPHQPDIWNNLGVLFTCIKDMVGAIEAFSKAIELRPTFADAYNNLGKVLWDLGQLHWAQEKLQQAVSLDPTHQCAHYHLGTLLANQNQWAMAEQHLRHVVATEKNLASARTTLAKCLLEQDKIAAALEHYRHIHQTGPATADSANDVAVCLLRLGQITEARIFLEKGLLLNPHHVELLNNLGVAYAAQGMMHQALEHYQRAVSVAPNYDLAYNNLGNAHLFLGQPEAAEKYYRQAIRVSPEKAEYYRNLSDCLPFGFAEDPCWKGLRNLLLKENTLSDKERVYLHYAMGKILGDQHQHEAAFEHYHLANGLKRKLIVYDEASALQLMKLVQEVFHLELRTTQEHLGHGSPWPIFIVGFPRSGSSLIEQIIASHPAVVGGGELKAFNTAVLSGRPPTDSTLLPYPEMVPHLTKREGQEIARVYLESMERLRQTPRQRVTDKMPFNFYYLGLIHLLFPKAKIIHATRHPIDTCLSCYSTYFVEGNEFTYDLGELGRYYHAYQELMNHWKQWLPPTALWEVNYEQLVTDFEPQTRALLDYLELPWDDHCREFYQTERSVQTASARQVRRPLYQTSINRWRPSPEYLQPLIDGLKGEVHWT